MLYKFRSKAGGDVIMMGPNGDQMLRLLGRDPTPQGIITKLDMAAAVAALEKAVSDDEAAFAAAVAEAAKTGEPAPRRSGIQLRQRAWPLVELMRHALREDEDVIWGV
ncbi:MAG: DUF1840 domain-containing protein [Paucibacter sp.]|nr:DUF1840 domain-containing protein [Roseateles sp.]